MTNFSSQLAFILEIDKLKSVNRRSRLVDNSRYENSAEHSWHLAMLALILQEHTKYPINLLQVLKMVLIHDIVEIDAGDTYLYDETGALDKGDRERKAANRIFGLLPETQAQELHALWQEFEARETADSRFANSLDRLMPLLHNYHSGGSAWQEHDIHYDQVITKVHHIEEGAPIFWEHAQALLLDAVEKGYLKSGSRLAASQSAPVKTEQEKMLAGELYVAAEAELSAMRQQARRLTRQYNVTDETQGEQRQAILRQLFGKMGAGVIIEPPFQCDYGTFIELADNVFMNFGCVILDCNIITIGRNTQFGPGVHIYAATHPLPAAERIKGPELGYPVTIGENVWVGGGAIICPGVTIGDNTTIGAGSVVTKDIPANVFAAGNPCRVIRHLDHAE